MEAPETLDLRTLPACGSDRSGGVPWRRANHRIYSVNKGSYPGLTCEPAARLLTGEPRYFCRAEIAGPRTRPVLGSESFCVGGENRLFQDRVDAPVGVHHLGHSEINRDRHQ